VNIISNATELRPGGQRVCLAIGFFDGVHLGHQQIIRQTIVDARQHGALALVLTFDRHPNTVVAPSRAPALIYPLARKVRAIEALGADSLLLIHFDQNFSQQPGELFIRELARDVGQIQSLCVGANFTFGHRRDGNVALLKRLGEELHFKVHGMAAVSLDGKTISSTRVREAVQTGDLDLAGQMLGRAYSLSGTVMRGDQLGRQLGFPTANINVDGLVLPPDGVYAGRTLVQGRSWPSVLNIGLRPTLKHAAPERRVEVHLLDFEGDLYGTELEVALTEKIRDEQKFESLDALKQQVARDAAHARNVP
jgi:riboflavin kinase/FMN adenylyltransferase